ncbi:hypothetical protein HMPREF0591_1646 [Mycobacterium parascrofulaceum ATCC BAA-614]|uniref:Uncharacterized protein n=1 Tax=Mycobacterium parascrofulaceum ATCC BAA-614 TaxID=525368 RepID=D5P652_9MYCO|nr:hypothetical protein HMPREF0591_1646 [Mycobacterium parascrofulaceum ATCC BAA-614]
MPSQDSAGKSLDDLAGLLIAAYTMAGTAINHGVGSLTHLRRPPA